MKMIIEPINIIEDPANQVTSEKVFPPRKIKDKDGNFLFHDEGIFSEKIFGKENISAIFGDTNPFSSIFGSSNSNKSGGGGGGGGSFASASSDEGIRKASEYAQSRVGTEGYGNNGCTTWCQVYLKQAGNPFADESSWAIGNTSYI